jgi:hypothetical protein
MEQHADRETSPDSSMTREAATIPPLKSKNWVSDAGTDAAFRHGAILGDARANPTRTVSPSSIGDPNRPFRRWQRLLREVIAPYNRCGTMGPRQCRGLTLREYQIRSIDCVVWVPKDVEEASIHWDDDTVETIAGCRQRRRPCSAVGGNLDAAPVFG